MTQCTEQVPDAQPDIGQPTEHQCKRDGVAVFFKQMGGKGIGGAGGSLLNGREIKEYPVVIPMSSKT